ncbi:MAG: response regulator [Alphaproteobacteria bacterium]|nr:response regulator [Alphaproteobacteria bacterium]
MPSPGPSSAPRILIVEDDATIALGLRMLLYHWGYDVIAVAASGEHALVLAAAEPPDLVLMDVRLEGPMDGIATAGVLRFQHSMPVLFLTAQHDPRTLERLANAEAGGVLLKPVDPDHLRATISELLARSPVASTAAE